VNVVRQEESEEDRRRDDKQKSDHVHTLLSIEVVHHKKVRMTAARTTTMTISLTLVIPLGGLDLVGPIDIRVVGLLLGLGANLREVLIALNLAIARPNVIAALWGRLASAWGRDWRAVLRTCYWHI
jgi:hypothetical protein